MRGTKNIAFGEAERFNQITSVLRYFAMKAGYRPFIPSLLAEQQVFVDKAGKEILNQMYSFKDRGGRDICLIPEVTAIVQKLYNEEWSKSMKKPIRLYYLTRCYRYERPQAGRYREFWQFGVEYLGGDGKKEVIGLLKNCLNFLDIKYNFKPLVKRGLSYYVEDGFEVEVPILGAQKQIAGGGRYKEGVGWAIGVERLLLATAKTAHL